MNGKEIAAERKPEYGNAWSNTGKMLQIVDINMYDLVNRQPELFFPWIMILNKLLRALISPNNQDHWVDIQGYAQLALEFVTKGSNHDISSE